MCAIGECIEKQIGKTDAGNMLRVLGLRREDEPLGRNAAFFRKISQALIDVVITRQQP